MTSPLSSLWSAIEKGGTPTRGEFRVFETSVSAAEGPVLLAIDGRMMRHLLMPIRDSSRIESDERSSGVHVRGRVLVEGGVTHHFVDVECRKAHLAEVFDLFISEVLQALPQEPGRPASVARRVLNRWRELLNREPPGILDEEALQGLYGELMVLRRLAQESVDAVTWWTGPLAARHDFNRGNVAVEVKTIKSLDRSVVRIHGVDQLNPPPDGQLYLVLVVVERLGNGGESVPDAAASIQALGVDPLVFASRLRDARYTPSDAVHYADIRFEERALRVYPVQEPFPRITRATLRGGDLPKGVSDFHYSVDLAAASAPPMTGSRAEQAVRQLLP